MVEVSASERGSRPERARRRDARLPRPPAIRIAVVGSALAGAMALFLVRGPVRPELHVVAGAAVVVAAALYLFRPRVGAITLIAVGSLICAACVTALVTTGTLPWLLTGFWGGSAALLAGLLDVVGKDDTDSLVGATVVAVVSLLLLSALGLGAYVRLTWTQAARDLLETVPTDAANPASARLGATGSTVQPGADGAWECRWAVRTRDLPKTWLSLRLAIESAGWSVTEFVTSERLCADKAGYKLTIVTVSTPAEEGGSTAPVEVIASLEGP